MQIPKAGFSWTVLKNINYGGRDNFPLECTQQLSIVLDVCSKRKFIIIAHRLLLLAQSAWLPKSRASWLFRTLKINSTDSWLFLLRILLYCKPHRCLWEAAADAWCSVVWNFLFIFSLFFFVFVADISREAAPDHPVSPACPEVGRADAQVVQMPKLLNNNLSIWAAWWQHITTYCWRGHRFA